MEADRRPDDTALRPERPRPGGAVVVAGLGASAGGVEALKAFFAGLPEIDGVAFVVILHLAPDEESRLADVLQSGLPLPVTQVTESVAIEPGHVYVIPPDKNLLAHDGRLVLTPIEEERIRRRPIDHFFRTLAYAYGERAVGVVLSGTGANGTVGVRALKEAGGLILAQDPADAAFEEMPRTAIASGVVDAVGPAGALAAEVAAYAHRLREVSLPDSPKALPDDGQKALQGVLAQLRARTGHDFAHYKRATVLRRLDRRLHVTGADSLGAYLELLREDGAEAEALLADLLISVTNFFRDPSAFAVLAERVPGMFEGKGPNDDLRAWVAGCATGEEAYSLAMLLQEHAATLTEPPRVQVFATDLSDAAVRTARAGVFPESIEADVSPERLRRFFIRESDHYRVSEPLREAVLFAPHSLLADPPFSRIDLVSCRNVLIYLQRELQQRVLSVFHYALRPGGLLFLGTSESTDGGPDLFDVVDKGARLFRHLDVETPMLALPRVPRVLHAPAASDPRTAGDAPEPRTLGTGPALSETERVHRVLREASAPPSVLVSEGGEVVHVSGDAAPFLQVTTGAPTQALARVLRPELRAPAQIVLFQARREGRPAASSPTPLDLGGEDRSVIVRARPAPGESFVQVAFEVVPATAPAPTADADEALAEALRQTQEQLQVSVEEFETSREELRAQNEELQSINEELRSTAEELETSKEEAQSMSEELQTVNDELKAKVDETARAKGDLENLIMSTAIATLFLDRELRIQRFTPSVRDLFHVLASDVGRPLSDLAQKFGGRRLVEDAEAVIARLETTEREVETEDGCVYLVHARPYRSADDRIDGVVVTFVDITRRKADEEALRRVAEEFRALVSTSAAMVWTTDAAGQVIEDSPSWRAFTGQTVEEWLGEEWPGEGWADAVHPDDRERVVEAWARAVEAGDPFDAEFRVWYAPDGAYRWTNARAAPLREAAPPDGRRGPIRGYIGMHLDVHERHKAEDALHESDARFRALVTASSDVVYRMSPDWSEMRELGGGGFLADTDRLTASWWDAYIPPEDRPAVEAAIARAVEAKDLFLLEHRVQQADGTIGWTLSRAVPILDDAGEIAEWIGAASDITARKGTEEALSESEARFRTLAETVPDSVFTASADGTVDYVSRQHTALTGVPPEDVLGTTMWPALVHPDDRATAEAAWDQAREGASRFEARYRLRSASGEYCWVIVRARPVFDDDGVLARWFGTVTDVDALTRAEAEVRELNTTLEARVSERTEQVRQLSARLAAAEKEERRRIALVLHDDLQQQLAGLAIVLGVISASPSSEKRERLQTQATKILSDAQALTRSLASELIPPSLASEDFADTLRWLADRKRQIHQLDVAVEVEGACEVPDDDVRSLLYHTLRELLFNVVKHAGTGQATVRAHRDGRSVVVVVEDDGDGFDGNATEPSDGGLGLFSVRERIEMAGGRLDVDSAPGRGTCVTITVPADGAPR